MMAGWTKEDPATAKKMPVEGDVPVLEYIQFGHTTGQHWCVQSILNCEGLMTSRGYYGWGSNPGPFVAAGGVLGWDSNREPPARIENSDEK
mmetsp:Transcript_16753/g.25482  ORF Transcript_16753/g.25482 Transcript_16753/m.25482 type:complete len:91 (+) Transcript_16753:249-521(+)